jgi:hypothetical protein
MSYRLYGPELFIHFAKNTPTARIGEDKTEQKVVLHTAMKGKLEHTF